MMLDVTSSRGGSSVCVSSEDQRRYLSLLESAAPDGRKLSPEAGSSSGEVIPVPSIM